LYELVNYFLDISSKDPTALIYVHPAVAVGITGLLINALNFIPIGRLDGGRVTMAIAGRQSDALVHYDHTGEAIVLIHNHEEFRTMTKYMFHYLFFQHIYQQQLQNK
jgi:membrane-associated protease RseP (regulator of RpoE activity)